MKILLLDIETAPNVGYTWGKWEQNVIEFVENWYILCFAYKWMGQKTKVVALPDFKGYKPGAPDDRKLLLVLWTLLNDADIIIAQNGDQFDIKKINTRFLHYKIKPPSPYKTIDTLKVARKFAFNSNKLNDLGRDLGVGEKLQHTGFSLWKGCMAGDRKSWGLMKRYNRQDVDLLERVYLKLLPWINNHPNVNPDPKAITSCPKCGSTHLNRRGRSVNRTVIYQNLQCQDCGGWCRYTTGRQFAGVVNA